MFIYNIDTERRSRANDLIAHKRFANFLELFFSDVLTAADDGYSGTNFNRPSWIEVMNLADNDEVATIIVKDMSRLGRDYLQVGQLTELVFPSMGIRFIAINDNIDSLHGENEVIH